MIDIALNETGNGGDAQISGNDIATTSAIFNQIYLALFGGNVEASTTGEELTTEQRLDWWGNNLLFQDEPDLQFNSTLEKTLTEVALNSSGRLIIEEAVRNDLKFLNSFAEIRVSTEVTGVDRISILIFVQEPDNSEEKVFEFIWDATKQEVIVNTII